MSRSLSVASTNGVEPLPNIRDGILLERLVKTVRDVGRCCQYVVQRPEGVILRQRFNVEHVDRRAGDLLVLQHADQSLLFDREARPFACLLYGEFEFALFLFEAFRCYLDWAW
jgi:hypothetical protein